MAQGLGVDELLIKNVSEIQDYVELIPFNFSSNYPIHDVRLPGLSPLIASYFGTCPDEESGGATVDGTIRQVGTLAENITVGLIGCASHSHPVPCLTLKRRAPQSPSRLRRTCRASSSRVCSDTSPGSGAWPRTR